jgi:hypothetical protein
VGAFLRARLVFLVPAVQRERWKGKGDFYQVLQPRDIVAGAQRHILQRSVQFAALRQNSLVNLESPAFSSGQHEDAEHYDPLQLGELI